MEEGVRALRVSQLDAGELDAELEGVVVEQMRRVADSLPFPSLASLLLRLEPELTAGIRTLFWHFSIHSQNATLGQIMMDMSYRGRSLSPIKPWQKWFYLVLIAMVPWLKERLPLLTTGNASTYCVSKLELLVDMCSLLNFLLFLRHARSRSLVERFIGLKSVNNKAPQMEDIDFSVMNRELLWHGFSDIVLFLVPLLNVRKIVNTVRRMTSSHKTREVGVVCRVVDMTSLLNCTFCQNTAVLPHIGPCGHTFCYYCAVARLTADENFDCPQCDITISRDNLTIPSA